jgi:hypothetical protein
MKAILAPPAEATADPEALAELAGPEDIAELKALEEPGALAAAEEAGELVAAGAELAAEGAAVEVLLQLDASRAIVTEQIPRPIARVRVERSDRMSSPCGHEGWEVVGLGERSPDWAELTTLHGDRQEIVGGKCLCFDQVIGALIRCCCAQLRQRSAATQR